MATEFNGIDYSSELEAAGVAKNQAAVHAKALGAVLTDVAIARDLVRLESSLRKENGQSEGKAYGANRCRICRTECQDRRGTKRSGSKDRNGTYRTGRKD